MSEMQSGLPMPVEALELFASVALMFWYILRLLMSRD